jgi:hypothetical protein
MLPLKASETYAGAANAEPQAKATAKAPLNNMVSSWKLWIRQLRSSKWEEEY